MFSYRKGGKFSGFISLLSKRLGIHGAEMWSLALTVSLLSKCKRKGENAVSWLLHSNLEFRCLSPSKFLVLSLIKTVSKFACHISTATAELNQDTDTDLLNKCPGHFQVGSESNNEPLSAHWVLSTSPTLLNIHLSALPLSSHFTSKKTKAQRGSESHLTSYNQLNL